MSLVRAAALAVVPGVLAYRTHHPLFVVLACLFGVLFAVAVLAPIHYAPVEKSLSVLQRWTTQAFSWCLLAVLFLFILTPVGLLRRLTRSRTLTSEASYWKASPKATSMSGQH